MDVLEELGDRFQKCSVTLFEVKDHINRNPLAESTEIDSQLEES